MTELVEPTRATGFRWESEGVRRDRGLLGASTMGHEPALDGLRAVAVMVVVLFHAKFSWIPGGFLGVSTFFTLSGFLITSLLLREWSRRGGLAMRTFWRRRFRRLLPASWATMGLVVLAGVAGVWTVDQQRSLRGDVPFSLAEVVNWHFIASGRTYGSKFEAPSPLEHFWSLAVEQQFYVVLPLLLLGLLTVAKVRRVASPVRLVAAAMTLLVVVSAVLNGFFARSSLDRAYFGTDTRAAELAAGALLACACVGGFRLRSVLARRVVGVLGVVGLGVSAVLWATVQVSTRWMYPWGFLLTALSSVALILGALQGGPLGRVLSVRPLVWLGGISYGVYLLHWPVFLWLTPQRTQLGEWPLFGLRMAVTVAAAVVMYRFVEHPVRKGDRLAKGRGPVVALVAAVALLATTFFTTNGLAAPSQLQVAAATPTTLPPEAPLRVMAVGDRLAGSLGQMDGTKVGPQQVPAKVTAFESADCGLVVGGWVSRPDGSAERDVLRCGGAKESWLMQVGSQRPDVVVVWAGSRDLRQRRLARLDPWADTADPAISEFLGIGVGEFLQSLTATGTKVVVLTVPPQANGRQLSPRPVPTTSPVPREAAIQVVEEDLARAGAPPPGFPENDPATVERWNGLLRLAATRHGATLLDAAAQMATFPGGALDPRWRTEGVGLSPEGARRLAPWLTKELRRVVRTAPAAAAEAPAAVDAALPPAPPLTPRRVAGSTVRALVVGDSVALNVSAGLTKFGERGDLLSYSGGQLGCPLARGGKYRFMRETIKVEDRCDWSKRFPGLLADDRPDVVVVMSGIWEVVDRLLPADDSWRHIGQPQMDAYVLREFVAAIDLLGSQGAKVVLLTFPRVEAGRAQGYSLLPESDPNRMNRFNELLRQAASLRPGVASVIDFQAWQATEPGGEMDPGRRPDGIHYTDEYVPEIGKWLGPKIVAIGRAPKSP